MDEVANGEQSYKLGHIGYTAYGDAASWLTWDNRPMPQWEDLPERTKILWQTAGTAIANHVITDQVRASLRVTD